ncbi:MAG TPA: beta-phosphoglucomutase family hydrolase [Verrucomicrobiota bacterium]|nr:beta-phosphoglucomutase family hydrolase [Verrucomicrobiota bacterium]HRZ38038.1 beta-phosphoglucomutase family hydrolase [Candidatus Paceibacterota bacterium]HRZ56357.1 beta-phosphoglucomutase family hydrolase [Candidatus Paceibacterota bacterium]
MNSIPTHIRALIFDFDGTLADTMPLHWRAWQAVAAQFGFAITEQRFYALGGVPSIEIIRMLTREQNLALDLRAVAHDKEESYLRLLDEVKPVPEVLGIVRDQAGRRVMAVASAGSRRVIERVLEHLDLRRFFRAVVTMDDVTRHKPAPDVFLEAARRLDVPPAACLAYEDTDLGLEAIKAAGMLAVDVRELRGSAS